jgi:uncharacterized membrane protein YbhN (UPF0104 family)
MSEHSFLKQRWRLILSFATAAALVVLVIAIHKQLIDTFKNLAEVNAALLLLLLPLRGLNYHAQAKMYQGLFVVVGNRLKYGFLLRVSLELNFVNQVFPSGGVSGISYFGIRVKDSEITGSKATLVQLVKLGLLFLSFEVLLAIGLLCLAVGGQANDLVLLITTVITTLMVVGTIGFAMIIGSQKRIKTIESRWRDLKAPFWWALVANLTEVLSIYVVFLAFGQWINIGAVILAYSVANFAGLISVLPGGVGIYEALMAAVLATAGVPAGVSLPVIVMFRVLSTFIQVPPGWILYHGALRENPEAKQKLRHEF